MSLSPAFEKGSTAKADQWCLIGSKRMRKQMPDVCDALDTMKEYSDLGRCLVDWSQEIEARFRTEDDPNVMGLYCEGTIKLLGDMTPTELIWVLSHEMMHMVQDISSELYDVSTKSMDARCFVLNENIAEAAADTCAVRVCYEAKLNGAEFPVGKKDFALMAGWRLFKIFDESYQEAIQGGADHEAALQVASDHVFHQWFAGQRKIDIFNNMNLMSYIKKLCKGAFDEEYPKPDLGAEYARAFTELDEGNFLVSEVRLPLTNRGIFGTNKLMRQAFDYVEFCRLIAYYDNPEETNYGLQCKRAALEADNNPYLGVDLAKVLKALAKQKDHDGYNTLDVMNKLAGVKAAPAGPKLK